MGLESCPGGWWQRLRGVRRSVLYDKGFKNNITTKKTTMKTVYVNMPEIWCLRIALTDHMNLPARLSPIMRSMMRLVYGFYLLRNKSCDDLSGFVLRLLVF